MIGVEDYCSHHGVWYIGHEDEVRILGQSGTKGWFTGESQELRIKIVECPKRIHGVTVRIT